MGKIKLNEPNLRQFIVVKSYYKDFCMTHENIFTSDSFKEAIKKAYKAQNDECYVNVEVYEADGETLVYRLHPRDIMALYKIREYLK